MSLSATAFALAYRATFSRACAISRSLKSVRRSFKGNCGVRGAVGMVAGWVLGGDGAAPVVASNSATMRKLARIGMTFTKSGRRGYQI
jgi:hypothetical protein